MPYRVRLRKALTELSVFLLFIKSGSAKAAAFLKDRKDERKIDLGGYFSLVCYNKMRLQG
jgi:hypothetical protein